MMAHLYPLTNFARKIYYHYNAGVKGSAIKEEPKIIKRDGDIAYLIDGFAIDGQNKKVVQFGILQADLIRRYDRGQNSTLAQFDGIVYPGLIMVEHIFRGLRRPLYNDGLFDADDHKFVHSWRPKNDFDWPSKADRPRRLDPVTNSVFVVIINTNEHHKEKWPEVYGWIDRWNWIYEDAYLSGAPMNWKTRYAEKLL